MTPLHNFNPRLKEGLILLMEALMLLLSGCTLAQQPVTLPAATPFPVPTPIAAAGLASIQLRLSPWPLHGPPPYTARFEADLYGGSPTDRCQSIRWHFGDGAAESRPCPTDGLGRSAG